MKLFFYILTLYFKVLFVFDKNLLKVKPLKTSRYKKDPQAINPPIK